MARQNIHSVEQRSRLFFPFQSNSLLFMDMRRWGKSRICGREPHELFRPFRTLRLILGSVVFISSLLIFTLPSQSACRDPDVARGIGSLAYAANVDATIQYSATISFSSPPVKERESSPIHWGRDGIRTRT